MRPARRRREGSARTLVAEGHELTDHKARKHLVRERMARTGESFTTAHRQVTTRRSGALAEPGLVPGYPAFGAEVHGPSALARHLLGQEGLDITEPIACGLGGGIGFLYAVFEYRTLPYPLLTIVAQHHPQPWLDAVTSHLGVRTTTVTSASARTALAKMDAALGAGRPAFTAVARGLIPWNTATTSEMEAAEAHPVVVAGRDGADYLLDDGVTVPRRIGREVFGEAWAGYRKGRFALTTVETLPEGIDLATGIRASLRTTTSHLTGPVLGNYFDVNMGFSGMAELVTELRDSTTKRGWSQRFSGPAAFEAAMTRLAECLMWQYTAPGATRPLYAQFLEQAAGISGLNLAPAVKKAARSGEIWTRTAELASTADPSDDPTTVFTELADLVEEARELEIAMVRDIRSALD